MDASIFFANVAGTEPAYENVLMWYLNACGWEFGPLFILLSIVFVTLIIMNWLAISRNAIVPPEMIEQFQTKLENKEYQEAYELAKESDSLFGRVFAVGLVAMSNGSGSDNFAAAKQAMDDTAEEEVLRLEHRLSYLGTIASIAPMIGLLGTVYGMIIAFSVIARGGPPQAHELAGGISLALVTTQIGLMIAIPALILFEVFKNRLTRLLLELNIQMENSLKQFRK
jgi:biopolymer transport protein ExbB